MALFSRYHQILGPRLDFAVTTRGPELLKHVGDVLEADQEVVDRRRAAAQLRDAREKLGRDQRFNHEAGTPRSLRVEHERVAENACELVAVEVVPGSIREFHLDPGAVRVGIGGQHDVRSNLVREAAGRLGRLWHLGVW